jgi:hypothetical protein
MFVWFGKHGVLSPETLTNWDPIVKLNLFNMFDNADCWVASLMGIFILSSLCLLFGLATRVACLSVFVMLASLYHRNPYLFNSGDTYMRAIAFWLTFSACGSWLSIDSVLAKRSARLPGIAGVPIWPLRLLQIQMCLVYAQAFVSKIGSPNWLNGTAVYYSLHLTDLKRFGYPSAFDQLPFYQLASWSTLAIEFSLFTLIWWKKARYVVLLLGIVQHILIEVYMNIPVFQWLMISSYVLFIDSKDLAKWWHFLKLIAERKRRSQVNMPIPSENAGV